MRFILTYLLALSTVFASAQNVSFSNKIIDDVGNPIPIATIFLQSNQVATTSSFDGDFKLVFPKASLPDTLIIRHISFETKKIFINKENLKNIENISLKTRENKIGEADVFAISAEKVIEKTIEKISENYADGFYFVDGFYRQAHKENNKYVRLIECFAQVKEDISNRNSTKQKESFRIENIRRSNVYERNGDQHGDHLVDLFSEDPINYSYSSFLNEQAYRQYDFSFIESPKAHLHKIYFQNKSWTEAQNKSGYVLINKDDYAIIEMKITSTQNPLDKSYNKSDWKFQNGTYKVQYEKVDEQYFCKRSSKYYNHYVLNEFTKNVEYIVEEYFDWWADNLSYKKSTFTTIQTHDGFDENGAWITTEKIIPHKLLTNLYSLEYRYNPVFWAHKIKIKLNQKVIDDLNSFMDLEKQFMDD